MRFNEIANADDQLALWRLISDNVWSTVMAQAKQQERIKAQAAATDKIDKTELQPGDLVFFNTLRRAFSHVGIYVGEGKFIHSPRPGGEVRIEDMRESYWVKRFNGARRVNPELNNTVSDASLR